MPTEILCADIDHKILKEIKDNLGLSDIVFIEVTDADYFNLFSNHRGMPGIVLIGENTDNPFQIAQRVHSLDKNVSILIISSKSNLEKFKQGLKLTPFIGNAVKCVLDESGQKLASIVEDLITRTRQRRSYVQLKATAKTFLKDKPDFEKIKTDFLDKYLEYAPIGTLLLSEGKIVAVNEYATHIFSKIERELIDKEFYALFPGKFHRELKAFIHKNLDIKTFERKNGRETQYLEIRLAEIPANYKLLILSDISDKVNAHKKIEDQLADLKKVNRDLDNFIYTASHDLKAPISNVEGLMNLLQASFSEETARKQQVKDIVVMIFKSIDRFKATINDLADITKIEKTFQEDQEELDIAEIIEEVKLSVSETIKANRARIDTDCVTKKIYFSRKNFKSILYNLISNAIKYRSPERTPEIKITCLEEMQYISFKIADNGLGIPADKVSAIFEMFKRLHSHVEGSGIGLFIVKRIVENANGKIEVESEEGKGTTFTIFFRKESE